MSHPRYIVSYTVSTSGPSSDVERAGWEHFRRAAPTGAWADALDTKVVAVGEGPAGEARPARISRSDFRVLDPRLGTLDLVQAPLHELSV